MVNVILLYFLWNSTVHSCSYRAVQIPSTKKWRILEPWRLDIWEYFSGHEHISLALLPWAYKFEEYCRKTKQVSHKFNCFRYQFNYSMLTSYGLCTNGGIFSYLQWRPVVLIIIIFPFMLKFILLYLS